jgi:hypothetical protein
MTKSLFMTSKKASLDLECSEDFFMINTELESKVCDEILHEIENFGLKAYVETKHLNFSFPFEARKRTSLFISVELQIPVEKLNIREADFFAQRAGFLVVILSKAFTRDNFHSYIVKNTFMWKIIKDTLMVYKNIFGLITEGIFQHIVSTLSCLTDSINFGTWFLNLNIEEEQTPRLEVDLSLFAKEKPPFPYNSRESPVSDLGDDFMEPLFGGILAHCQ